MPLGRSGPRAAIGHLGGVEGEVKGKDHLLLAFRHQRSSPRKPEAFRVLQERWAGKELQRSAVMVRADRAQATIAVEDFLSAHGVLPNSDPAAMQKSVAAAQAKAACRTQVDP